MTLAEIRRHLKKVELRLGLNQPPFPEFLFLMSKGDTISECELVRNGAGDYLSCDGRWIPTTQVDKPGPRILTVTGLGGVNIANPDLINSDLVTIFRGEPTFGKSQNMSGEG